MTAISTLLNNTWRWKLSIPDNGLLRPEYHFDYRKARPNRFAQMEEEPIVVLLDPDIENVEVTDETITAILADGRTIGVPLVWSWRLAEAAPEQRANFEIIGDGEGVH